MPALLLTAVFVGFLAFAFSYWIMQMEFNLALATGIAAGVVGLAVELIKPLLQKKRDTADKEQHRKS